MKSDVVLLHSPNGGRVRPGLTVPQGRLDDVKETSSVRTSCVVVVSRMFGVDDDLDKSPDVTGKFT